jgi:hypothetical protein
MMKTENLTSTQTATLFKVLPLMLTAENNEISEYTARTAGANLNSLRALVRADILAVRYGDFIAPIGTPYAGQTLRNQAFYTAV